MAKKGWTRGKHEGPRITGRELEADLFGEFPVKDLPYLKDLKSVQSDPDDPEEPPYVEFDKAYQLVLKHHKDDPEQPRQPFSNELRQELFYRLGIDDITPEVSKKIKFYTAVHTPLDRWHGTDAFFLIETDDGTHLIKLDASKNPHKREGDQKADLLIREQPSPLRTKEFSASIDKEADRVYAVLKEQILDGRTGFEPPRRR